MIWRGVSIRDFQSYRGEQAFSFDPTLTLLAGRNDVGKSALMRAIRIRQEPQEGAGLNFMLRCTWEFSADELRQLLLPRDATSADLERWIQSRPTHTLTATFVRNGGSNPLSPGEIFCKRIELRELDAFAEGDAGTQIGWTGGPFSGGAATADLFQNVAYSILSTGISYVSPRRVEQGARQLVPAPVLAADASNLTHVVHYLMTNERPTLARLERFLHDAFPQINNIGAPHETNGPSANVAWGELKVYYADRNDPIPLRLCGSGIEQMLALAAGILTVGAPRLFLIDEPQAYLHPHAERSLLQLLKENPQHQYVVATHSAFFLNARPVSQARLLTVVEGETEVNEGPSRDKILAELGLTAADLWSAEAVLWVEGASEVAVIESVAEGLTQIPSYVRIRPMPDTSRFSSRSTAQAEATYRFCESIVRAVSPLPIKLRFLFDADEKDAELKQRIVEASGGRAEFLPVRELENLFLDAAFIHEALTERCELVEREPPTEQQVSERLEALLAEVEDRQLFPIGPGTDDDPRAHVVGSKVLQTLYWEFTLSDYDKVRDGRRLAEALRAASSDRLQPLIDVLRRLIQEVDGPG